MNVLTRQQRLGVIRLWQRTTPYPTNSYIKFRRKSWYDSHLKVMMVPFHGMIVGIEEDGYAHT